MWSSAFKEMVRKACCEKLGVKRGRWSEAEDAKLIHYIKENGEGSWSTLPKNAGLLRCGKSCRLRWINYLRPDLEKGRFSSVEEELIIHLHASLGTRWSMIARHLSGRTDNGIKNYWNSHLSRKIHPKWRREISDKVQVLAMNVAKLDLPPDQKHGRKGSSGKKNQTRVQKSTQLPVLRNDADVSPVIDPVSPLTAELITTANQVASDPDGGNYRENMEHCPETAMREQPVEAEKRLSGLLDSESNILVINDATNCFGDEMTAETVDGFFCLAELREEVLNVSGSGGGGERESGGCKLPEMAEEWDGSSLSGICREEDEILSWLWDGEDLEKTNLEMEVKSEKLDAMFAWLLS